MARTVGEKFHPDTRNNSYPRPWKYSTRFDFLIIRCDSFKLLCHLQSMEERERLRPVEETVVGLGDITGCMKVVRII